MLTVLFILGLIAVVASIARTAGRQQRDMRGQSPDLRRADDGGDPAFRDYGSPMG